MSKYLTKEIISARADVVGTPVAAPARACQDRSFEVPTRLYGATVGLYAAFIAIMALGFQSSGMIIPVAIFAIFVAGLFGVPAIWTRIAPTPANQAKRWSAFKNEGISTWTGKLTASDVSVQMLVLPVLIVGWGLTVVTIAAIVR